MTRSAIRLSDNTARALASEPLDAAHGITWIVCFGAERQVADGRAACPRSSSPADVAIETCLGCRHLMATPVDRMAEGMCSSGTDSEPAVRWASSSWSWRHAAARRSIAGGTASS